MKTRFGDLIELNPKSLRKQTDIPRFVAMENVEPGFRYVTGEPSKRTGGSGVRFEEGDVLFARITPCLENGKIAQYLPPDRSPGRGSTEFFVFRAKPDRADQAFIYYLASSQFVREPARLSMRGASGRQRASQDAVLNAVVPDIPLNNQRGLAAILSAYDDLIFLNARRIAILEEMARRLFDEWFVKFRFPDHNQAQLYESEAGLIPKDWKRGTVGALAEYINRGIAPSYDDGDYPAVINQRCIRAGRLNLDLARRQSRSAPDEKLVRRFDVLVNSTGVGTLGRVAQAFAVPPQTSVDTHVTIVRPHEDVDPYFFGVQLITLEDKFTRAGTGSTGQTELSRSAIAEIPVAIPPRMLQRRFGFLVAPMREETEILAKQNALLRTTRDLLLPKLISGEISLEPELPIQTAAE